MRNRSLAFLKPLYGVLTLIICLAAALPLVAQHGNDEVVPALEGLDPVLLIQGKEAQGNLKISVTRGHFQYFFANEEDKALFEKEPAHFEIQLNGSCARMGAPVNGSPDLYSVHKGRIYIFGSPDCKTKFDAAPEKYLESENVEKPAEAPSPEARKKGDELIDKAVKAMGSPSVIDSLSDYQEKSVALQTRRGTDVELKVNLTILFPDRVRADQSSPDYANPTVVRQAAVVMSGREAFVITKDGVNPMPDAYRADQQHELDRKPLAILRARKNSGFGAAAIGGATIAGNNVEQVSVTIDGLSHTLGIDPASGRILSLSYKRRGPGGEFGQVVKTFSDFREVNGVTLPFRIAATFNGQPWKEQSSSIESIAVNSKVDPAIFEKPKAN
jgi:YHS domain-containing protein